MTAQLTLTGDADIVQGTPEAKALDVAYTPRPVARQLVDWIDTWGPPVPDLVLDPSAGAGVFGVVAREVWPAAGVIGVEPRDDELLPPAYDETWRATAAEYVNDIHGDDLIDVIVTNPPFSLVIDFVELLRPLLTPDGMLILLLPVDWWQRNPSKYAWATDRRRVAYSATHYAPNLWERVLTIGGAISFRGKGEGADTRNYAGFVWRKEPPKFQTHEALTWPTEPLLPFLPSDQRKWITPPGRT